MPYAIRRIFDGKLLPLPRQNTRNGITWAEFDDDILNAQALPALWPTKAGATSTMKMWKKGGWSKRGLYQRGGKWIPTPAPDRNQFPVEVVQVKVVVVDDEEPEQLPREAPNPRSTL